ncbi:putative oxidoreductase [Thermoflexales bacterium]|nr:putative oxidoreductase [Thermoflexales bacterium]
MKTTGNTILITGGATGIGLALAEAFLKAGNEVVICGRRTQRLLEAQSRLPEVHIKTCDVADAAERQALFDWTVANFRRLNILVNNAGIQRPLDFANNAVDLLNAGDAEVAINLQAPIQLSALFIPHLRTQAAAAIVNITSVLGFIPLATVPVYCATKAALHSFSWALRHQLRETSVKVFEVAPPVVDTELQAGVRSQKGSTAQGISPQVVAEATLQALAHDHYETAIGAARFLRWGARLAPQQLFKRINA